MLANGFHHKNIGSLKEFLRFDISYCTPIEKVESTQNELGMGTTSDHTQKKKGTLELWIVIIKGLSTYQNKVVCV
jgi:hypothetical protein